MFRRLRAPSIGATALGSFRQLLPQFQPLEQLLRLNTSSSQFNDQISVILHREEYRQWIECADGDDVTRLIDFLDTAVEVLDSASSGFGRCLLELRNICGARMTLPASYTLSSQVSTNGCQPVAFRNFGDEYEGTLSGSKVCVKRVWAHSNGISNATKTLYQEAIMWKRLKHKNIVPLLGITTSPLQLVSEWMPGGELTEYIGKHLDANRLGLLRDIAEGLHYLHSRNIVHGNLRGPNILVDNTGHAQITDFGLATIACDLDWIQTVPKKHCPAPRWAAPEVLRAGGTYSKEADIFSFAMVMIEVFTGALPFNYRSSPEARFDIMKGTRPPRPTHPEFTNELWALMQHCWSQDPRSRPEISRVMEAFMVTELSSADPMESAPSDFSVQGGKSEINLDNISESSSGLDPMNASNEALSVRILEQDPPRMNTRPTRDHSRHELPTGAEASRDLGEPDPIPTKPSIRSLESGSSLQILNPGHSIEIPAVQTSPDATNPGGFIPPLSPPPLIFAEINAECQNHPGQELIEKLDMMLDHAICDRERHALLNILCKMCSRQRMLPKSMHVGERLTGELVEADRGGRAIIFRAQLDNRPVAVKTVLIYTSSDFNKRHSEFCREAVAWRHLQHPNILPLFGVDLKQHQLSMISEWMDEGNLNEYLKRHGGVNRLQLLADVATGLEYMHSLNMVHGDLKGANILINPSHRACLADFGLSTIIGVEHNAGADASSISSASKASLMSFTAGGSLPWMSPELLDPERFGANDDRPTKKSDCYALGMVVYEVLSGNPPYWDIKNQGLLIHAITEGYRPKKPDAAESLGFTGEMWKIVQHCWLADASARPDTKNMLSYLNRATWLWGSRRPA